ncbi:hypothetical protein [Dickeya zeae]|uniref:hypothetical protein n=1 Tax=Dickeya zeae TaxID=204042 RepID=UPI001CF157C6|nr:hypothetical protein [Dickeya zeae]MCA6985456.1 hypothetical protein [Dickeya zeae]
MKHDDLELTIVPKDSNEWHLMWSALGNHEANRTLSQPTVAENFGEVWQYMETGATKSLFGFGKRKRYFHYFRHRLHPTKGADYRLKIPASKEFKSTDLVTTWSLKSTSQPSRK